MRRHTKKRRHSRTMKRHSRRAGMFRAASSHARRLTRELGKELIKDVAEKSLKKKLREDKGEAILRLSSGKLKRAQSRLADAHMTPTKLSGIFESMRLSPTKEGTPMASSPMVNSPVVHSPMTIVSKVR